MINNQIFFFGSTHHFIDESKEIIDLVKKYNIKILLLEELQDIELSNKQDYMSLLRDIFISPLVDFEKLESIISFCEKSNIMAKGIDFKNYNYSKDQIDIILQKKKATTKDIEEIEKVVNKREKYQLDKIKTIQEISRDDILVILGAWHLRSGSHVLNSYQDKARYILPCNPKGLILKGPPQELGKNIIFLEKEYKEILSKN